jgi:bifunctional enzyme CysN/CysC
MIEKLEWEKGRGSAPVVGNPATDAIADAQALRSADRVSASYLEMDLLRFTTAGSVDDGKSTLIGRLLYDTKSIFQDQLEAVESASRRRGEGYVNLALLTDGLRAEREQNITIDVAYRYFATPKRKFIIADTPGHIQYTRNMVTGASTAELAIVLVDARKGVLTQSKRHGFIASLLRIPHIVVAINKMDLVDFDEAVFERIVREYTAFAEKLEIRDLTFIPISALRGDNVVTRSEAMPWYSGGTLLHHLETVNLGASRNLVDFRFPVQYVVRPNQDFRGYAGRVASGTVAPGEEVVVLPSGHTTRIRSVETPDGPVPEASAGDSVILTVEDEIDISRGDMVVRKLNIPAIGRRLEAILCWTGESPMDTGAPYILSHTTRQSRAFIDRIVYRIDVDTLHRDEASAFRLNDIGRVQIETAQPLFFDSYHRNQATGNFILIDPNTNVTVAAGMIRGEVREPPPPRVEPSGSDGVETPDPGRSSVSPNVRWEGWNIARAERARRNGHEAAVVWLTGVSGAGKTTIAREVERKLYGLGCQTALLDGDMMRHGLCGDLGFTAQDRAENIRRAGEVAKLFFEHGLIVLCAFVSPFRADREQVREMFPPARFLEVHVHCDRDTLVARDTKGLYARAAKGEITNLSGVGAPYESPSDPDVRIHSHLTSFESAAEAIVAELSARKVLLR